MRNVAACVLSFSFLAPTLAEAQTTEFYAHSQPGDPSGGGATVHFTPATTQFQVYADYRTVSVTIRNFDEDPWLWWTLRLSAAQGAMLAPGFYEPAFNWGPSGPLLPELQVHNTSASYCSRPSGRFVVYEIEFNIAGTLTKFAADFEQHCEDLSPALIGGVRLNSTRPGVTTPFEGAAPLYSLTIDPAPDGHVTGLGIDCGPGRNLCAHDYEPGSQIVLTAVPSPGYIFLGWEGPSDCSGTETVAVRITRRKWCKPVFASAAGLGNPETPDYSDGALFLDRTMNGTRTREIYPSSVYPVRLNYGSATTELLFTVAIPDSGGFMIRFSPAVGEALSPGTYDHVSPRSSWSGGIPALWTSHNCSSVRFQIHELALSGSTPTSIAVDFEMRCGQTSELWAGSLRWNSTHATLVPFAGAYPTYVLDVSPTLGGHIVGETIDCGDGGRTTCRESLGSAQALTLQAVVSPGYTFLGWGGACMGTSAITSVVIDRTLQCTAAFTPALGSTAPSDPIYGVGTFMTRDVGTSGMATLLRWPNVEVTTAVYSSNRINFTFEPPAGPSQYVTLGGAPGQLLPGDYDEAYQNPNPPFPSLQLSNCNVLKGRYRVYEAVYADTGEVLSFAADFEALCSSNPSPVHRVGAIRFNSSRLLLVPFDGVYPLARLRILPSPHGTVSGPGIDCGPNSHTDCVENYGGPGPVTLIAMPSPGYKFIAWGGACSGFAQTTVFVDWPQRCYAVFNALYPGAVPDDPLLAQASLFIDSEPGEPVGGGLRRVWTDALLEASSNSNKNQVRMRAIQANNDYWTVTFGALGTDQLQVGTYEGATTTWNGARPYFTITSPTWAGCSGGFVARFVVHEVTFEPQAWGDVLSFAADFEQRCTATGRTLRGSVRYNSTRPRITPFETIPTPSFQPTDFSGDGSPDLVWRNSVTGRNAFWFMNGDMMGATPPFSAGADLVADLNWEIRAVGDMNRDGGGDVIWQHATNGKLAAWLFIGATRIATPLVITLAGSPTEPDLDWKIVGAADMNADGHTDILWRHRVSGALRIWHMVGMEQWDSVDLPLTVADQQWQVAGIADMNRDGWGDIVWRHYGTGRMAVWYMTDTLVISTTVLPTLVSDTQWRLAGVADLNRDGHADFVWQHLTGGRLAVWYMNGLNPVTYGSITPAVISDPNWRVVGVR